MKKLVIILLTLALLAISAMAEETGSDTRLVGQLAKSNYTEEEFNQLMTENVLPGRDGMYSKITTSRTFNTMTIYPVCFWR